MCATVATLFVFRDADQQRVAAALSRTSAAAVSCALLIGVGAVVVTSTRASRGQRQLPDFQERSPSMTPETQQRSRIGNRR